MTRGRKNELTDTEKRLLRAGLLASLRSRRDRFWAAEALKVYEQLFKKKISWGTILPALRRLEDMNCLTAKWDSDEPNRRPIRYYSLTQRGRAEANAIALPALVSVERALLKKASRTI
jgi:DNA-binding MarR family transcriptional regulator